MKIGIIKENKVPTDARVPLTPRQCAWVQSNYPIEILVETSTHRCFSDEEYQLAGVQVVEDVTECDVLMGVKEVPVVHLIPNKTYLFFSHTIKKQTYNRRLLQEILARRICMIDYETLTDESGNRLIAFGRWAGIVGAHNGIWAYAQRTQTFQLPRMTDFRDFEEAKKYYETMPLPPMKIVLTGTGRVGSGAAETLDAMSIRRVSPSEFLEKSFEEAVYTHLASADYIARKDGKPFVKKDFYENPESHLSTFDRFYKVADVMINGIFWDARSPQFFTKNQMRHPDFYIKVIADVTCDIAPLSSIPSTLYATKISDPVFGYNPLTEQAEAPYQPHTVDMMTIDNLPTELPRDASEHFGTQFIGHILEELFHAQVSEIIQRATIAQNGELMPRFLYLSDFVASGNFAS